MGLSKFIVGRPDGSDEGYKVSDKIDSRALSFFAAIARTPSVAGFDVLSGSAYIQSSYVTLSDTFVSMGIGGNFQTNAIPSGYFNYAVFSLNSTGTIVKTEGIPAATVGSVVVPPLPVGNAPICRVLYQDNGLGSPGTITVIPQSSITDIRPFIYSDFSQPEPASEVFSDFKVTAKYPISTAVNVAPGKLYMTSGDYVSFPGEDVDFGTGGNFEAPEMSAGYYNVVLLVINNGGLIDAYFGTPNAVLNSVVWPSTPVEASPLAIITIQDNGSAIAGSINLITQAAINDVRPFMSNFEGQIKVTFLDYCRVRANKPADKTVTVNSGVIYPNNSTATLFNETTIDFGSGPNQLPAIPTAQYQRILLVVNASGNLEIYSSPTQALESNLVTPAIPNSTVPLAYIDVQDDGTNAPGSIRPINQYNIQDLRPFLGAIQSLLAYTNSSYINQIARDLYVGGTSSLLGTPTAKYFPSNVSIQALLSPVKAVVGPNGTYPDLQSAINAVSSGSLILIDSTTLTLSGTVNVNKNDLTIIGCGRGSVVQGDGTFVGLNVTGTGVKIKGVKFSSFTTAVQVTTESCMIIENYFHSNTTDVDYSGVVKIIIESNIRE